MPTANDKVPAGGEAPRQASSLRELVLYFLRLGATGFGGPIALAGYMERDLVEARGWIAKEDYKRSLALAQLAPGPLAAQLAIGIGYAHSGNLGATLVGIAFVLPSFFMTLGLSIAYVKFGGLSWMQAVFYGIGACVMGIIAQSAYKLTRNTIGDRKLLWAVYAVMLVVTAVTRREIAWLFFLSGAVALFVYAPPKRLVLRSWFPLWLLAPIGGAAASPGTLGDIFIFFAKAGAFVFGSGLAIVPFLYGGVVSHYHWLNERQFLDAVAVAMITPGPVVITVVFIGYLVAGIAGACAAALGIFLPVYLFVVIPAPWFWKNGANPQVQAFVDGVTAAAVGALTGAVLVLARGAIRDVPTALIAAATLFAIVRYKTPEPLLVAAAGIIGLVISR
jgi:chromate transporter